MRSRIKKLIDAANVIDRAYAVKGRSMAVKPNIIVLFYAIANSENLSQSQLHNEWLLPEIKNITITGLPIFGNMVSIIAMLYMHNEQSLRYAESMRWQLIRSLPHWNRWGRCF